MPELGQIYTVERIRAIDGGFGVRLVEIVPNCHAGGICSCGNCGWDSSRFRKIPRRHDKGMASLRALLDCPSEAKQPVHV